MAGSKLLNKQNIKVRKTNNRRVSRIKKELRDFNKIILKNSTKIRISIERFTKSERREGERNLRFLQVQSLPGVQDGAERGERPSRSAGGDRGESPG